MPFSNALFDKCYELPPFFGEQNFAAQEKRRKGWISPQKVSLQLALFVRAGRFQALLKESEPQKGSVRGRFSLYKWAILEHSHAGNGQRVWSDMAGNAQRRGDRIRSVDRPAPFVRAGHFQALLKESELQ